MIQKKIVCNRCRRVIKDYGDRQKYTFMDILNMMAGNKPSQELGYAEISFYRVDGTMLEKIHLCAECYDVAAVAMNNEADKHNRENGFGGD